MGSVVPMAAGGVDLRAFTASCSFALLSFARASGRARAQIELLVALGECPRVEVRVSR